MRREASGRDVVAAPGGVSADATRVDQTPRSCRRSLRLVCRRISTVPATAAAGRWPRARRERQPARRASPEGVAWSRWRFVGRGSRVGSNDAERRLWNDPTWSAAWLRREALTGLATPLLLEQLGLGLGERVLDVGCGAGASTLAAAALVGPTGEVLGADISVPLIAHATRRAAAAGVDAVRFVVADVQEEQLPGAPFDVAMSQFGVMY